MPDYAFAVALEAVRAARDRPDRFFDVHCLMMSAKSVVGLMPELAGHRLLPIPCARIIDSFPPN
jgi:hypothetical protein